MRFYLAKDQPFCASRRRNFGDLTNGKVFMGDGEIPVKLIPQDKCGENCRIFLALESLIGKSGDEEQTCQTSKLQEQRNKIIERKYSFTSPNYNLPFTLGLASTQCGSLDSRNFVIIRAAGDDKGNILDKLKKAAYELGLALKIKIEIFQLYFLNFQESSHSHFGKATNTTISSVITNEVDIDEISTERRGREGAQLYFSSSCQWNKDTCAQGTNCYGIFTISVSTHPIVTKQAFASALVEPSIYRKILDEEVKSDVTIIAENGVAIKCHKCFLAVHSSVFETMFKDNFKESEACSTIEMPDMSVAGVKAFLAYLYYSNKEVVKEDLSIALELLQAAHKYDIPKLEQMAKDILLSKGDNWFNAEVALKLFLFARNYPEGEALKMRAVKLLKIYHASLKNSSSYEQLFMDSPRVAMELCENAFSV